MRFDSGRLPLAAAILVAAGAISAMCSSAIADEGGVPFWLSGQFGSLAATPQTPGWSLAVLNYYTSIGASGNVAAAREVTIGKLSPNVSVNLNVNLKANADLVAISPGYVFATPVFGGQFAVNMAAIVGQQNPAISGTLTASVGPLVATREGSITDSATGFGDLYPQMALRWNAGVHSWMVYAMGDIPVGEYNSSNLANLGIGHGATRRRRGVHLLRSQDRPRIFGGDRIDRQFQQPEHGLHQRHRLACRLGRVAVPVANDSGRRGRLFLPTDHARPGRSRVPWQQRVRELRPSVRRSGSSSRLAP